MTTALEIHFARLFFWQITLYPNDGDILIFFAKVESSYMAMKELELHVIQIENTVKIIHYRKYNKLHALLRIYLYLNVVSACVCVL